jgi:MATE family multidrug resistance protein
VRRLSALALPVVAGQVATMLMGFVDTIMVGRVSVEALAAASLGNIWTFGTLQLGLGVIFGMDPIVSQAHGAGDTRTCALALQRGVVLALLLSIPIGLFWFGTESFLVLVGQDAGLARDAHRYTLARLPGLPFVLVYFALRQYLQGRELVRPAMWVIVIANGFNAFFNWVLIFGNLGFPALGLVGAGYATALTRIITLIGLVVWVRGFRLHAGAWVPWSRAALEPRALLGLLGVGMPIAVQIATELWAFNTAGLLVGTLGAVPLAAHTVAMNMASLAFMMPLGIAQGAATRVGNLIGAGRPDAAQRAAWIALALGAGVMTFSAFAFVAFRQWLPRIYTPDPAVIAACAAILPIAAAFQIFDGTQVVGCGVLRGMGRTRPAAVFNLIAYWLLGLPLGAVLGLRLGLGLAGIWWGLCLSLAVAAGLLLVWVRFRGPARVPVERVSLESLAAATATRPARRAGRERR